MASSDFKQIITINDLKFTLLLSNISGLQYKLIIFGNELEYACILYEEDRRLERLRSALLEQHGISINYKMFDNLIEISLHHSLFVLYDKFFLYKFHRSFMN